MVTALDCAVLSEDVYNRENNNLAHSSGWNRLDAQNWSNGFAAGLYEKDGRRVVAFRGTDDLSDAVSDARMVPSASPRRVASVTPAILNEYGLHDRTELTVGSVLLSRILINPRTRQAIDLFANQAPPEQTSLAREYLLRQTPAPAYITGHSLGGALAKTLSLREGSRCIAFNSPLMGNLRGVPPLSTDSLTSINARSDPLSLATRQAGNLPHGQEIIVDTPRCPETPPAHPEVDSYRRSVSCPRASGSWWASEEGIYAAMAGNLCEVAMEIWEPFGRAATAPQRNYSYWVRQWPRYVTSLLRYLGNVALYYHSMNNLRTKMATMPRFQQALR